MRIYQLELTNYCTASCTFCPHPRMTRPKGFMSEETFTRCISRAENRTLCLHHFGEPLLHRKLPHFIRLAKAAGKTVDFSTNGSVTDVDFIKDVLDAQPDVLRIAYDFFRPDAFIRTVLTYNTSTVIRLHAVTKDLLTDSKPFNNFAGQVEGETEIEGECYFKKYGYFAVLWDGRIVPCCQDFDGRHILGNVNDDAEPKHLPHYSLCEKCKGMQFVKGGGWWNETEF